MRNSEVDESKFRLNISRKQWESCSCSGDLPHSPQAAESGVIPTGRWAVTPLWPRNMNEVGEPRSSGPSCSTFRGRSLAWFWFSRKQWESCSCSGDWPHSPQAAESGLRSHTHRPLSSESSVTEEHEWSWRAPELRTEPLYIPGPESDLILILQEVSRAASTCMRAGAAGESKRAERFIRVLSYWAVSALSACS